VKPQFILFLALFFLIPSSYCDTQHKSIDGKRFVLGLDAGFAASDELSQTTQFPLGFSTLHYTPDGKYSYSARYGVSLGRAFKLNSVNKIIIGLSYHQFSAMWAKGTLEQGITPPLYGANYQYAIQLSQLLAEAKIQHQWHPFYPYLTAGIGAGFNSAKRFSTTIPNYLTVTPVFTHHSNSSLSYMLGLGIDTQIAPDITVGVGYVFSDLGQAGLGNGSIRGRTLSNYLNQSHVYVNTLLAQLNVYF
jgi:opacity protein-like surface antigen